MDKQQIMELFNQLAKRLDALEGVSYKFWIPVIISAIAALLSVWAIIVGKKNARKAIEQTAKNAKAVSLQTTKSNIDMAKAQFETVSMELAPLKAKMNPSPDERRELDIKQQILETVLERLLNGYNTGCALFYKDEVNRQDFSDMYHADIGRYVNGFPEKFTGPLTGFDSMLKYFNEYHKKTKAQ